MSNVTITSEPAEYAFRSGAPPRARLHPGDRVGFETSDASYVGLDGDAIDAGRVDFRQANRLSGPVWVEGAERGDALGFVIEEIKLGERAFVVYVSEWRRRLFGLDRSMVVESAIRDGRVQVAEGRSLPIRPMIGCIGVAPAHGQVSSLAPTGRTGGNMDLCELEPGSTIWLPVEISGALLSLGDLHARMGRGEPVGSGLECSGLVTGRVLLAKRRPLAGPVVRTNTRVAFVGTDRSDWRAAEASAVRAAWTWLTEECQISEPDAMAMCAGLLEVNAGGPAGNNVVASFPVAELVTCGVSERAWPLAHGAEG